MRLDLLTQTWSLIKPTGVFPPPRMSHASALFDSYMVIQGGEGLKTQSGEVETEPLLEFPSSTLDGGGKGTTTTAPPNKMIPGQLAGVCPGDTLQGLKMGPSLKVDTKFNFFLSISDMLTLFYNNY